jgi:hypothetical protein
VVVAAFYQATGTALIAIVLLLFLLLRRFWDVALVMAPLALAALLAVAVARLAGLDLNLANIIVLPLLLGLGVDSGIHLVMRARDEAAAKSAAKDAKDTKGQRGAALLHTSTPRAVLFSALTTVGSFGALATSGHRGTASMGLFLTIAIGMTLLCMLIVLPAMMALRENGREDGRKAGRARRRGGEPRSRQWTPCGAPPKYNCNVRYLAIFRPAHAMRIPSIGASHQHRDPVRCMR